MLLGPLGAYVGMVYTYRPSFLGTVLGVVLGLGMIGIYYPRLANNRLRDISVYKGKSKTSKAFILSMLVIFFVLESVFLFENGLHILFGRKIESEMYVMPARQMGRKGRLGYCETRIRITNDFTRGRSSVLCVSPDEYSKISQLSLAPGTPYYRKHSIVRKLSVFGSSYLGLNETYQGN